MTRIIKISQKELKKPDKFKEFFANVLGLVSDNYPKILAVVGVIIVILAGAFAMTTIHERRDLGANSKFTEAIKSYLKTDSETASQETLNKFLALKKEYPQAEISKIALYYSANINYNMGKYDEAIKLLKDFLKSGVKDQLLVDAAYLTIGTANFSKGNWQQAMDYLTKLDNEGNPYRNQAKFYIALSLERLGKISEAEKIYGQLLNNGSNNDLKLQVGKKAEGINK
jgi:hypothetical protein